MQSSDAQAVGAAQAALAAANAGGSAGGVSVLGDLTPPKDLDLGAVTVSTPYYAAWKNVSPGADWLGGFYANADGTSPNSYGNLTNQWGEPGESDWYKDGSCNWSTATAWNGSSSAPYPNQWQDALPSPRETRLPTALQKYAGYGWWTEPGFAAPPSQVFDPFAGPSGAQQGTVAYPSSDCYPNGFGLDANGKPTSASNFGLVYGTPYANWKWSQPTIPATSGFAWLPAYALPAAPPASAKTADAVQQEQTGVSTLAALATVGEDVLQVAKNLAPADIKALTGVAKLGAAAGFAALTVAMEAQAAGDPAPPQSVREAVTADVANPPNKPAQLDAKFISTRDFWMNQGDDREELSDHSAREVRDANKRAGWIKTMIEESAAAEGSIYASTALSDRDRLIQLREVAKDLQNEFNEYAQQRARAWFFLKYVYPDDPLHAQTASISDLLPGGRGKGVGSLCFNDSLPL